MVRADRADRQAADAAVEAIHRKFAEAISSDNKSYRARLAAGEMLIALRKRIEAGEAGEVEWWPWYCSKFVRSRKDAEKVMRLADERQKARGG